MGSDNSFVTYTFGDGKERQFTSSTVPTETLFTCPHCLEDKTEAEHWRIGTNNFHDWHGCESCYQQLIKKIPPAAISRKHAVELANTLEGLRAAVESCDITKLKHAYQATVDALHKFWTGNKTLIK